MQNKRPIILCTFSNDVESSLRLDQEERSIREALRELDRQQHVEHKSRGQVNLDDIYNEFNTFHNRIYIFHYGGHSDSEFLHLQEHHARSEQLAILIGQQKHLKMVFLNGCANRPQVQFLLDHGVPAVIATSERVHDEYACQFAAQFYEAFAGGKSIQEAFNAAKSYVLQIQKGIEFVTERGCRLRNPVEETMPWGLYYEDDAVLNWHIGMVEQESTAEIRAKLKQASRERYRRFNSLGGRFQHLSIDDAILTGIRDVSQSKRKPIEDNIALDGLQHTLHQSLPNLWSAPCSHAMLVGPGGMGKTVSLLRLWEQFLDIADEKAPIPIFIQLNEFNSRPERDFIIQYIKHYADLPVLELLKEVKDLNGQIQPNILLLLDGLNEVTASSNEILLEINRLRVPEDYPGLQLVITSRVDLRSSYQWHAFHLLELQGLSKVQILDYLGENAPQDAQLLDVLRNPMMLSLYAAQSELPIRYHETGLLRARISSVGELLANVEAIQRIKIEEQNFSKLTAQALRRFVLEHLTPFLAWQMQQAGLYYIEEADQGDSAGLFSLLSKVKEHLLNRDFFQTFKDFRRLDLDGLSRKQNWELLEELIYQICCKELTILVQEDRTYRFLHQNFRDYFAARHVQNEIIVALQKGTFPAPFHKAPLEIYVRQMLGELEGEHYNKPVYLEAKNGWSNDHFQCNNLSKLLAQCRGIFSEEKLGFTVWNILTIWTELRGELSGTNLSKLSFYQFSFNNKRLSRRGLVTRFNESLITEDLFLHQGHSSELACAVFSPDGQFILTASQDTTAKIWDSQTGQCLLTLEGHSERIDNAQFSPDGKQVLTASWDNSIKIWDALSGQCLQTIEDKEFGIYYAAYSPDGKFVVSPYYGGELNYVAKIWEVESGRIISVLQDGELDSNSYAIFHPDGKTLITLSFDIKVWDFNSGHCLFKIEGNNGYEFRSAAYSPDGKYLATASKLCQVWDTSNWECVVSIEDPQGHGFYSAVYSLDGLHLLTTQGDCAQIRCSGTGECLMELKGEKYWFKKAVFSPDGSKILSTAEGNVAKVWDAKSGQNLLTLDNFDNDLTAEVYSSNGQLILIASRDHTAKLWDTQNGLCVLILEGHSGIILNAAISDNNRYILTSALDETAKLWDTQTGLCILTLNSPGINSFSHVALSPDGSYIATVGYEDNSAVLWDSSSGRVILVLLHDTTVNSIAFNKNGRSVLTTSNDNLARVWDIQTGKCLFKLGTDENPIISASYSPNMLHILTISKDKTAIIWDAFTGKCLHTTRLGVRGNAVLSPDNQHILTTSAYEYRADVWRADNGKCLMTLVENRYWDTSGSYAPDKFRIFLNAWPIERASFSPDGNFIVVSFFNLTKIWDFKSGKCFLELPNSPSLYVQGCDFRNLHHDSIVSESSISILRQYGSIFNTEDAKNWSTLMEKHFGVKPN